MDAEKHTVAVIRPYICWKHALTRLSLIIAGGYALSAMIVLTLPQSGLSLVALGEVFTAALAMLTARSNALLAIRLYQRYAPEHVRQRCAMTPTCSEYAVLAILKYGMLKGCLMTHNRLRHRCNGTPITDYP